MNKETLEGVRNGDKIAVRKAMESISIDTPRDELAKLWVSTLEGIVRQSENGSEGVGNKLVLMSLSLSIMPLYTREGLMREYANLLKEEGYKSDNAHLVMEALTDTEYDETSQLACIYEDLMGLAMICSEESLEGISSKTAAALRANTKHGYKHAISVGAAVASGMLDEETTELAKKCLIHAARNGDEGTRKFAVEALSHFIEDYELKRMLVEIERSDSIPVTKAASYSLRTIREKDEVETARADLGTLSEIEYPDDTSPQRWYIDIVFNAVNTVLTHIDDAEKRQDVLVSLKQLAAYGAEPGPMKDFIGESNLAMVKRNVENALVHALINGDERMVQDAVEGIRRSGSERVIGILEKVAQRERNGDGRLSEKGHMIRKLIEEMQGKRFGHSLSPPFTETRHKATPAEARLLAMRGKLAH